MKVFFVFFRLSLTISTFVVFAFVLTNTAWAQPKPVTDYEKCGTGYKNKDGNWQIPPRFEQASTFHNQQAVVVENGFYGIIDTLGNYLMPAIYNYVGHASDRRYFGDCYDYYIVKEKQKYGILSSNLEWITTPSLHDLEVIYPCKFFSFRINKKLCGIIGTQNDLISPGTLISREIDLLGNPNDSLFRFKLDNRHIHSKRYGVFDGKSRKIMLQPIYSFIQIFDDSLILVRQDMKKGLLDKHGNWIHKCELDFAKAYYSQGREKSNPTYRVIGKDERFTFVDSTWTQYAPTWYDEIPLHLEGDLFKVTINGKYGLYNHKGEMVVACNYDEFDYLGSFIRYKARHILSRNEDEKYWGIMDIRGKEITNPIYEFVDNGAEDSLVVVYTTNRVIKYFDLQNHEEIPFSAVNKNTHETPTRFSLNGLFGYVNKDGKEILPPEYQHLPEQLKKDSVYIVSGTNKRCNLVDHTLNIIPNTEFDTLIYIESENLYWAIDNGLWGIIAEDGKAIMPLDYTMPFVHHDMVHAESSCNVPFSNPMFMEDKNGKMVIFDLHKGEITPPGSNILDTVRNFPGTEYTIRLKTGEITYLSENGKQMFPAISHTTPLLLSDGNYLISKNNEYGTGSAKGEILIEPGKMTKDQTLETMSLFFENRESPFELGVEAGIAYEILNYYFDFEEQSTDFFYALFAAWSETGSDHGHDYGYFDYCSNDPCIRNIFEKLHPNDDLTCWPQGYGTFVSTTYYFNKIGEGVFESKKNDITYGHAYWDDVSFDYFGFKDSVFIRLEMNDFFDTSTAFWSTLSELAVQQIKGLEDDLSLSCSKNQTLINSEMEFSLTSDHLACWLMYQNEMQPLVIFPYAELEAFIPKSGFVQTIRD